MGCCCFNTLRGAAFFVSSIQIYNGLECILKFILFPMVFSSLHDSKDPGEGTSFITFMPGMVYAILYFLLGCAIFRGIEQECARTIRWGGVCFAITEVCFFILRQVFKVTPTPKVPHLPIDEQPFEMNIYKTLYYFLFTIVGGLIYICILFLYLQQLSNGQDEFAHFFNISARPPWSSPTPTTTTQAPQPPTDPQQTSSNNNSAHQSNLNPNSSNPNGGGGGGGGGGGAQRGKHHRDSKHQQSSKSSVQQEQHLTNPVGVEGGGGASNPPPPQQPQPRKPRGTHGPHGVGGGGGCPPQIMGEGGGVVPAPPALLDGMKDPGSPHSPMFPYFLMRRSSKGAPPSRCLIDDEPSWHPHPTSRGPPPMPPLRQDQFSGGGGGGGGGGVEQHHRNLLSPSRLVNHGHPPPPAFQPIIPPFYPDSGDDRRDSFPFQGYQSGQSGYSSRLSGGAPESLYQKIPSMSPAGFDYCLR